MTATWSLLAVAVRVMFRMVACSGSTHRFETGGPAALVVHPAPYLLVLVSVVASGVAAVGVPCRRALQTSVPTMLVLEPIVAVLLGILVLGEG